MQKGNHAQLYAKANKCFCVTPRGYLKGVVSTVVWKFFLVKCFLFKKGRVKNISWLMLTHENRVCVWAPHDCMLGCTIPKSANGRVRKRELVFVVTIFIGGFGMPKLESKCMSCVRVPYNERD